MTAPDTTAGTPDVSTASTFESEVNDFFGDSPEAPEPDTTTDAGTTPGEATTGTDGTKDATAPAGDAATATAGEGTTPDAAQAPPVEDDPFKDTTPATFTVNGKTVTNEGIRIFKEGGGVITQDALPDVLNKLSERESLFERNRAQSVEYQTLAKVSEWTDPSTNKTYTGPDAAIEMRIGNASLVAENKLLVEALTDPDRLASILTTEFVSDGRGGQVERVVLDPRALAEMQREAALQRREMSNAIREHFKGIIAQASKPQPAPVDYAQATPALLTELASVAKLDASVLTPEDRQTLAEQLPFHIKDGLASLAWQNLAKRMMQDRAQQKTSTQTLVKTTADATKEGQLRMAAAARGVKPLAKPATAVRTPQPDPRLQDQGDAYDMQERAAAQALRAAS